MYYVKVTFTNGVEMNLSYLDEAFSFYKLENYLINVYRHLKINARSVSICFPDPETEVFKDEA